MAAGRSLRTERESVFGEGEEEEEEEEEVKGWTLPLFLIFMVFLVKKISFRKVQFTLKHRVIICERERRFVLF